MDQGTSRRNGADVKFRYSGKMAFGRLNRSLTMVHLTATLHPGLPSSLAAVIHDIAEA